VDASERELADSELEVLRTEGVDPAGGDAQAVGDSRLAFLELLHRARTAKEASELLGVSQSRVRQRLGARGLYGVKVAGDWRLPAWQFVGGDVVPGLDRVLGRLSPDLHPLTVQGFMLTPQPELATAADDLSPLDWLIGGGDPEPVAALGADL
jgi:hypothetical protein